MKKIILNLAMSIDGYIATNDGKVDWIRGDGSKSNVTLKDMGFDQFLNDIQTIMMGKNSYEVTNSFAPITTQFPGKKIIVFTHQKIDDLAIKTASDNILKAIDKVEGNIWLFGGGDLVKQFLEKNLVTDMIITIVPTILGKGITLFKPSYISSKWELVNNKSFNGMVTLTYKKKDK